MEPNFRVILNNIYQECNAHNLSIFTGLIFAEIKYSK